MFAFFIGFSGTSYSSDTRDTSLEEILLSMSEVDDTPELIALLEQILVFDPLQRPEVSDVLHHTWFACSSSSTTSSEPPSERLPNLSTSAVAILDRHRCPRLHPPGAPPNFWTTLPPPPHATPNLSFLGSSSEETAMSDLTIKGSSFSESSLDGSPPRIAVVRTRWNKLVIDALLQGANAELKSRRPIS